MAESAQRASTLSTWQTARVEALEPLTAHIRRVVLRPQVWHAPQAGQHLDLRLTADDGYQAQRSYSLLSPPELDGVYELGIERLADGEVSPWFHDAAQVGDTIEMLGPVGGHFVWHASEGRPTLLIGGGSGVVPLLSMAAHRAAHAQVSASAPMVLLVAARTLGDVLGWGDLQRWEAQGKGFHSQLALSRDDAAPRAQDHTGRLRQADVAAALQHLGDAAAQSAQVFVCGRNAFVEDVTTMLRELMVPDGAIRTERFGG
jgi:ferredoxin-NADP reductase